MRKMTLTILAALTMMVPVASTAQAAPPCGERKDVIDRLGQHYAEALSAVGITSNGGVVELLTSADGKTWTLIFTYPGGPSCLVAAGEGWQDLEPALLGPNA